MPPHKKKNGSNRSSKKDNAELKDRELVFKEDLQEYAQVTKITGNGRLEAMCFDGVKRMCYIRGKLKNKVIFKKGDIILVSLRDYQNSVADVILKYTPDEASHLKDYGELPASAKIDEVNKFGEEGLDEDEEFDDNVPSVHGKE